MLSLILFLRFDTSHLPPKELEVKDTSDTVNSASYLELQLKINDKGKLLTNLYDKHDEILLDIVNFPFICGNVPSAPAYGVFLSQLIRYTRACRKYANLFVLTFLQLGF